MTMNKVVDLTHFIIMQVRVLNTNWRSEMIEFSSLRLLFCVHIKLNFMVVSIINFIYTFPAVYKNYQFGKFYRSNKHLYKSVLFTGFIML